MYFKDIVTAQNSVTPTTFWISTSTRLSQLKLYERFKLNALKASIVYNIDIILYMI